MSRRLELIENWDGPKNEYWIAVEPLSATVRATAVLIGPQSKTLAELETIAAEIRADLDRILAEARDKIARQDSV